MREFVRLSRSPFILANTRPTSSSVVWCFALAFTLPLPAGDLAYGVSHRVVALSLCYQVSGLHNGDEDIRRLTADGAVHELPALFHVGRPPCGISSKKSVFVKHARIHETAGLFAIFYQAW